MNSQSKRKFMVGGAILGLSALVAMSDPIADIRISHDTGSGPISMLEAKLDLGLIAFSFLHSWRRALH